MPKWGLTSAMRGARPYGLPSELLAPAKIITDPVHGDIRLTELERRIVDSPPFQRLRRVKQLGTTHLVYPGGTHTRFSHSLGAVVAAQLLLDVVLEQRDEPHARSDLFAEWEQDEDAGGSACLKRVAEATVLTRLGALLHDLCHIPFGHSVEDELRLLDPHDENEERFDTLWAGIDETVRLAVEGGISLGGASLKSDLMPLILSKLEKSESDNERDDPGVPDITYPFAHDIVGNTVSADLMDYLTRDHRFTGLPAALGHRFLDSFYVSPKADPFHPQRMVLRVVRKGRERKDTLTELLKFLRYRYELSERALAHHAKLAADAMVGKLFQMYNDGLYVEELQRAAKRDDDLAADIEGIGTGDLDGLKGRARKRLGNNSGDLEARAKQRLEEALLVHGDDGLLEHLYAEGRAREADSRWAGVRDLAGALLNRQLFKPVARMSDRSHAKRLWESLGSRPDTRRQVEQVAADRAGIRPAWYAVMWIPPERMRLKPALVLVDDEDLIDTMLNREYSPRGEERGAEIYKAHRDLWALEVFVHPSVRLDDLRRDALLGAFAEQLHINKWDDDGAPVLLASVAQRTASEKLQLTRAEERELSELVPAFYDGSVTLDQRPTLDEMVDEYELSWYGRGREKESPLAPQEEPIERDPDPSSRDEPPVDDQTDAPNGQQSLEQ